ncbi:chorismate mutase [Pseudalkalibacillus hwajinpoensis]|uniref:chorismate mutase n=1 Tax=Guptibacillus hwajinpoensis TaxID=208199 RepID=A0A4U1MH89_9BACL|nr:chorismate mutase [Pseudalkalibacillus hwajinpoensis]TKD69845.1 chorismate mutase [Pseudalkalibacillus hwajinpoensis]
MIRGIRGATTVNVNEKTAIVEATTKLLKETIEQNKVTPDLVASIHFTMTKDLDAVFPAEAVRLFDGWANVPLLCSSEIDVEGSLPFCIRILMTVNTTQAQDDVQHVYLENAVSLRPDLAS